MNLISNPSDYIWSNIQHLNGTASTTKEIEKEVKKLFKEIGATSACFNYPLPEGKFPAYICTSANEVACHGIPTEKKINWDKDVINVDISFKWQGKYYDTCQSWGKQLVSKMSKWFTTTLVNLVKEGKILSPAQLQDFMNSFSTVRDFKVHPHYAGHGVGAKIHLPPLIPSREVRTFIELIEIYDLDSFTIEPIIQLHGDKCWAQTELQIFKEELL